jgi:putative RNA 2'-phosphotransferase
VDLGICKKCGYFEGRCKCGKGEVLLKENERLKVSKFLSGLLRHFGRRFGLMIDEDGWVRIDDVLRVLKSRYDIGRKHLELIVAFDKKGRFEIRGNRIRARYGHSINVKSDWSESDEIPSKLYHATHPKNLESIFRSGLLPMRRREVHMCATPEEAIEVGKRYSPEPILLEVDAKRVLSSGIKIRKKGKVYTADWIPPEFLRLADIFCHI